MSCPVFFCAGNSIEMIFFPTMEEGPTSEIPHAMETSDMFMFLQIPLKAKVKLNSKLLRPYKCKVQSLKKRKYKKAKTRPETITELTLIQTHSPLYPIHKFNENEETRF
jgi:hypothetical protein